MGEKAEKMDITDENVPILYTYPKMNRIIVKMLKESGQPHLIYAAARIKELERQQIAIILACEAAVAYDEAIVACSNSPARMASFCTSQGDTLDTLYVDWISKSKYALDLVKEEEDGK
jgi:hypothetical protein